MKIYMNVRDTASDFNNEVNIVGLALTFEGALKTHKSEVEKARKLANEMGYKIEESVGDLSFRSFEEDNKTQNHYNVLLLMREVEEDRSVGEKLSECISTLKDITQSGYIPFASPAPSSTEGALKRELNSAIERLESTLYLHNSLYHGK